MNQQERKTLANISKRKSGTRPCGKPEKVTKRTQLRLSVSTYQMETR
jgi:hypothetical protein